MLLDSSWQTSDIFVHILLTIIADVCGEIQKGMSGVIVSPNYPFDYKAYSDCVWKIEAPLNTRIKIKVIFDAVLKL